MAELLKSPTTIVSDVTKSQTNDKSVRIYTEIVEEPSSKGQRFRYECEKRNSGNIPGKNSTPLNKTFPSACVVGYRGRGIMLISCVTKKRPYQPHPHKLVGTSCRKGICMMKFTAEKPLVVLSNIGIQCTRKRDAAAALDEREQERVDPFRTGFDHKHTPSKINLKKLRLCFQAFLEGRDGKINVPLPPVVTNVIREKKSMKTTPSDLKLENLESEDADTSDARSIVKKINNEEEEDIEVCFYRVSPKGTKTIEACATLKQYQRYGQCAISCDIPNYTKNGGETAKIYVQLVRPSNAMKTEMQPYRYDPLPTDDNKSPGFKSENFFINPIYSMLAHICNQTIELAMWQEDEYKRKYIADMENRESRSSQDEANELVSESSDDGDDSDDSSTTDEPIDTNLPMEPIEPVAIMENEPSLKEAQQQQAQLQFSREPYPEPLLFCPWKDLETRKNRRIERIQRPILLPVRADPLIKEDEQLDRSKRPLSFSSSLSEEQRQPQAKRQPDLRKQTFPETILQGQSQTQRPNLEIYPKPILQGQKLGQKQAQGQRPRLQQSPPILQPLRQKDQEDEWLSMTLSQVESFETTVEHEGIKRPLSLSTCGISEEQRQPQLKRQPKLSNLAYPEPVVQPISLVQQQPILQSIAPQQCDKQQYLSTKQVLNAQQGYQQQQPKPNLQELLPIQDIQGVQYQRLQKMKQLLRQKHPQTQSQQLQKGLKTRELRLLQYFGSQRQHRDWFRPWNGQKSQQSTRQQSVSTHSNLVQQQKPLQQSLETIPELDFLASCGRYDFYQKEPTVQLPILQSSGIAHNNVMQQLHRAKEKEPIELIAHMRVPQYDQYSLDKNTNFHQLPISQSLDLKTHNNVPQQLPLVKEKEPTRLVTKMLVPQHDQYPTDQSTTSQKLPMLQSSYKTYNNLPHQLHQANYKPDLSTNLQKLKPPNSVEPMLVSLGFDYDVEETERMGLLDEFSINHYQPEPTLETLKPLKRDTETCGEFQDNDHNTPKTHSGLSKISGLSGLSIDSAELHAALLNSLPETFTSGLSLSDLDLDNVHQDSIKPA